MTPKELLYIEDVLGHQKQMQTVCSTFSSQLQESDLKNLVTSLAEKHSQAYGCFYNLLNS